MGRAPLCPHLQPCGEESELSWILIKNGYVVTNDVARNVYPSVPAARGIGPSFFHEILPASDARSHEMTERQPDAVGTIGKVTGVHLFCSGIPNLGKAQLQHPFGKGGRLKEGVRNGSLRAATAFVKSSKICRPSSSRFRGEANNQR